MQCRPLPHISPLFSCLRGLTRFQWSSTLHLCNRNASTLASHISTVPLQSYVSASDDPYLNLSFEHHLLQSTPPESTALFLYINRPCVVIGRNQNPWAEVNLRALATAVPELAGSIVRDHSARLPIDLVRRRSGGGTVFHDYGNVNWTVISPAASFTRDKHVEMVVRGLRSCGIERARVNERHDIVLDTSSQESSRHGSADDATHCTKFTVPRGSSSADEQTVKVSGSAYKLTRGRALHHGTCLLASPHLSGPGGGLLSRLLHAPGAPFITAKGVASVRSPVANVGISPVQFIEAVQRAFARMYSAPGKGLATTTVHDNVAKEISSIDHGMQEMKALSWKFGQTPQFTLSLDTTAEPEPVCQSTPTITLPNGIRLLLEAKHALITNVSLELPPGTDQGDGVAEGLMGRNLADAGWTWREALMATSSSAQFEGGLLQQLADAIEQMLPLATEPIVDHDKLV